MRFTRRTTTALATAAALGTILAGCATGAGSSAPAVRSHDDVTVYTWWAEGVEQQGLNALATAFEEQNPGIEFVDDGITGGGGSAAKEHLQTRLETQDPPDSFLAHAGAELQDYIDGKYIQDLSPLYQELGLTNAFPEDLIERLSTDGKIYSVPSNIHRANVMWVNPAVLQQHGLDPSGEYADLDGFIADLETLKAAGVSAPLSVGTTWAQVHLLETVLLADLGPAAYNGLWSGETDWSGPEVTTALEHYRTLLSYSNPDRDDIDWQPATEKVIAGESAFNVMGDWALTAFESQGKKLGTDFLAVPSPGTSGEFDFLADSFTMSTGILDEESAKAWLKTIGSKEGQVRFNKIKGSIPAREDVDAGQFTPYQQMAIKSFRQDTIVSSLAHGAAVPVSHLDQITAATAAFSRDLDVAAFQSALVAAAAG
ncbi:ABC transporter substrate-binding protein [Myceligenerans crystallogenes]